MTADADIEAVTPQLVRMRRYTTRIMVGVVAAYILLVVPGARLSAPMVAASLIAGALTVWQSAYWERGASLVLTVATLGASGALWWVVVARDMSPISGVSFFVSIALVTSVPPRESRNWAAIAVLVASLPVVLFSRNGPYLAATISMTAGAIFLFRANRFGFNLYVEIDEARHATAELAVLRERYRFAADLHDIQGQALHVSRLQLSLADRLLDDDPARARTHLREAAQLIADALTETRRLAYGGRTVTLAGELANSRALIEAAGITVLVTGTPPTGHRLDELFGLVVREATTNLLRHAHAGEVTIVLGPDSVRIVNDGAVDGVRTLRGLARLGERFAAAGGVLTTSLEGETFVTAARAGEAAEGGGCGDGSARGGSVHGDAAQSRVDVANGTSE